MRLLIFICLICNLSFAQKDSVKYYKFTVGANFQLALYSYEKYISNGSNSDILVNREGFGYKFNLESIYQNKYFIAGVGIGVLNNPVNDGKVFYSPHLKFSYNLRKKSEPLEKFFGPFISTEYLFSRLSSLNNKPFYYRLSPSFGLLARNKFLQFEIGTLFRKNYAAFYQFKSCFFISIGYHYTFKDNK